MELKICNKCGISKPIAEFVKVISRRTGYGNTCKKCINLFNRARIGLTATLSEVIAELSRRELKNKDKAARRLIEMVCIKCNENKPLSDYYSLSTATNGRKQPCKPCYSLKRLERREYELKHSTSLRRTTRLEVLAAYGNKCSCCGESEPAFLSIDHINNDGASHRRQIKRANIYWWLKRNNFPKDNFELLCHNCNMAKGLYGKCPHKQLEGIA